MMDPENDAVQRRRRNRRNNNDPNKGSAGETSGLSTTRKRIKVPYSSATTTSPFLVFAIAATTTIITMFALSLEVSSSSSFYNTESYRTRQLVQQTTFPNNNNEYRTNNDNRRYQPSAVRGNTKNILDDAKQYYLSQNNLQQNREQQLHNSLLSQKSPDDGLAPKNDGDIKVISNQKQVQFLFFMGLEGTGHHYLKTIMKSSPSRTLFEKWELMDSIRTLTTLLWNGRNHLGLFNAWCDKPQSTDDDEEVDDDNVDVDEDLGMTEVVRRVAKQMQEIETNILQQLQNMPQNTLGRQSNVDRDTTAPLLRQPDPGSIVYVPVNVMAQSAVTGMMSYPNYYPPCRGSPDLHLWYEACALAQVDCQHVFLHRPMTDFLQSAIQRRFAKTLAKALTDIYYMAFSKILVQLTQFPGQTKACIGVLGTQTTGLYKFGMDPETRQVLQEILGWNWPRQQQQPQPQNDSSSQPSDDSTENTANLSSFEEFLESVYRTPKHNDLSHLIEEQDKPWWNSMQRLERQIGNLCRSNVELQQKQTQKQQHEQQRKS